MVRVLAFYCRLFYRLIQMVRVLAFPYSLLPPHSNGACPGFFRVLAFCAKLCISWLSPLRQMVRVLAFYCWLFLTPRSWLLVTPRSLRQMVRVLAFPLAIHLTRFCSAASLKWCVSWLSPWLFLTPRSWLLVTPRSLRQIVRVLAFPVPHPNGACPGYPPHSLLLCRLTQMVRVLAFPTLAFH